VVKKDYVEKRDHVKKDHVASTFRWKAGDSRLIFRLKAEAAKELIHSLTAFAEPRVSQFGPFASKTLPLAERRSLRR
jgi:hypothetical protein